jgi:TFIIF-interacting CTD phosphatase-like protein
MSEKWQKSLWQPHGFVQIGTSNHQRFKYGNNIMGDHKMSKYWTKTFMGYNTLYNDTVYSKEASKSDFTKYE